MKSLLIALSLFTVPCALAASPIDAKLVEKFNANVANCGAPGMEPKPKMAEFVTYLQGHGFKDVKLECGVSNYGPNAPMIMLHLADGGEIYVNFKKVKGAPKVSEIIEDSMTPDGKKRHTVWPPEKPAKKAKE